MFFAKEKDLIEIGKKTNEMYSNLFELVVEQGNHIAKLEEEKCKLEDAITLLKEQAKTKVELLEKEKEKEEQIYRELQAIQDFSFDDVLREIRKGVE